MPRKSPRSPRPFTAAAGVACRVEAAAGEKKLGTFTGKAYTGRPMTPSGWGIPIIIDLDGVRFPSQKQPALRQHDHEQIVGHTTKLTADKDGIDVEGVFSGEKVHSNKVTEPAGNDFPWQMSIGADPIRIEFLEAGEEAEVNGITVTGPMDISRETEVSEVSFVPLGADDATSATVSASKRRVQAMYKGMLKAAKAGGNVRAAKYSDNDIEQMDEKEAKAALKKCMAGDDDDKAKADDDDDDKAKADGDDDDKAKASDDDDDDDKPKSKAKSAKGKKLNAGRAAALEFRTAIAAEERRTIAIQVLAKKYGANTIKLDNKDVSVLAHALENDWTPEKVELELLKASRATAAAGNGPLVYPTSTPNLTEQVLESAIFQASRHSFHLEDDSFYFDEIEGQKVRRVPQSLEARAKSELKARYSDQSQQYAHTLFKDRITPKQMLTAAFRANGIHAELDLSGEHGVRAALARWDEMERASLRAEGASNLSISNILSNVQNKYSLQGYLFTEFAWREIAQIIPVNDFKAIKSINMLGDVMFKQIGASNELANASLGDQAFANQAAPYGRILTIPWTHLVNDDLSMLTGAPMKIGQGAGLAVNDLIWTLWFLAVAGTTTADDGNPFFNNSTNTHGTAPAGQKTAGANKLSGGTSVLSSAGLTSAKALFDNQVDPNGNPLGLDLLMPILLFGPTNWRPATELLKFINLVYGGGAAALQPNGNVWAGTMKPVMSRYIENANYGNTKTGWGIIADPRGFCPVIQVAFLGGQDTPTVLQAGPDYQFDRLGISIRGTLPFGATMQNFRGGVWSLGA